MSPAKRKVFALLTLLGYGRWRTATDEQSLIKAMSKLDVHGIEDIICGEFHLDVAIAAATALGTAPRALERLKRRRRWADKANVYQSLREAGLPVPKFLTEIGPQEAADILGFPMVIKSRIGNGGYGVRIVQSIEELAEAFDSLATQGWGVMFEEYIPGKSLCYVAAFSQGNILRDGAYAFRHQPHAQNLPSTRAITLARRDVSNIGRQIVEAIGGSDLVNIDIIDSPAHGLIVVDVNLRVWGNIVALNSANGYFERAYLSLLEHQVDPGDWRELRPNTEIRMFPTTIEEDLRSGRITEAICEGIASFADFRQWTDLRYLVTGGVTLLLRSIAGCAKLLRFQSSPSERTSSAA